MIFSIVLESKPLHYFSTRETIFFYRLIVTIFEVYELVSKVFMASFQCYLIEIVVECK